MKKNTITKDTVPENFTVALALADMVPVVFFGLSAIRVGGLFDSPLFVAGAAVCLLSGVVKVLWKLIAALRGKNVWFMFVQMRIAMPVGLLMLLAALIADRRNLNAGAAFTALVSFPACLFFALGALGMALMCVFAVKMDSADPKANRMEQTVNAIAQISFFIGLMLV